jgi:hypothetical protein
MSSTPIEHTVYNKVEGTLGHFNDVVVFTAAAAAAEPHHQAKYNIVYFGGDIQVN